MASISKDGFRSGKVDTGIGDALAVDVVAVFLIVLTSGDEVALQHDAGDAALPRGDLLGEDAGDFALAGVVFVAVAVAAIDHHVGWQLDGFELVEDRLDDVRLVVWPGAISRRGG